MNKLTLKQKLIGMTIILSLMVVLLSVFFVNRFNATGQTYCKIPMERVPQQEVANLMAQNIINARVNINELFGVDRSLENYERFAKRTRQKFEEYKILQRAMLKGHKNLGEEIEGQDGLSIPACREGGEIEALTQKAATLFSDFAEACDQMIVKKRSELELVNAIGWYDSRENSQGVVKVLVETGRKMEELAHDPQTELHALQIRAQEKNILQRADERYIERLRDAYLKFDTNASGEAKRLGKTYINAFEGIFANVMTAQKLKDELKAYTRKGLREKQKLLDDAVHALKKRASEQMAQYTTQAISMEKTARNLIMAIALVVTCISIVFGWFVSNGINKVLRKIIEQLSDGASQVSSASGQVSASSQSLAEGSSEQAASIEETSSSLEEMSSMTKQNADHASQADALMKDTNQIVARANGAMIELTDSMQEISQSSNETSKIIKTIDEIAFQTNLLALNAAVEAARAGEAGAGFAVVADEVRNLAMRAAEAAKNTARLIESTVNKVEGGSETLSRTNEAFSEVQGSASKVAELVGEIAAASNEQAQGIGQVNTAVNEMDKVVQQNAANAEESASASEEMNAQAEQMLGIVTELVAVVGGNNGESSNTQNVQKKQVSTPKKNKKGQPHTETSELDAKTAKENPDKVIPLDAKDDFQDF